MNVVGIDLGVHKIALANMGETPHVAVHQVEADSPRAHQLWELASFAQHFAVLAQAGCVWVEKPIIGNNRKYSMQLSEVCGAVMYALANTGYDIRTVDHGTWKKELLGNGHAGKDDIRNYINVTHGAYAPLCGDDQDAYDATCVGLYGQEVLTRAADLQLDAG